MAVKYLAGNRLTGTDAERLAMTTSSQVVSNTSWKELTKKSNIQIVGDDLFATNIKRLKKLIS